MKEDHLDKMDNKDTKKEMIIKREEEKMIEVTEEIEEIEEIEETDNKENIIKMMIEIIENIDHLDSIKKNLYMLINKLEKNLKIKRNTNKERFKRNKVIDI